MGYLPPGGPPGLNPHGPPRLNVDRFGLPKDYATYVWLLYRRHVVDESPARRAFLYGPDDGRVRDFGQQVTMR